MLRKNRKQNIALTALRAAMDVRKEAGIGLYDPVSIEDVVRKRDIEILFTELPSLDGMYHNGYPPRIIISSLRPRGRQAFTCAHEFGHHYFGHGTKIDELVDSRPDDPDEYTANRFASFLLMPKSAVGRAFTIRGWNIADCTPLQAYIVSNWLGVGYQTLIHQMSSGVNIITSKHGDSLLKQTPKSIKADLLENVVHEDLIIVDNFWTGRAIDAQVGDYLKLPPEVRFELIGSRPCLEIVRTTSFDIVFRGIRPGLGKLSNPNNEWASYVRICRRDYTGRSQYKHLEDPDHV